MLKSKLVKSFIFGLSLSVIISSAAFAQPENERELKIQIEQVGGGTDAITDIAPDTPVSSGPVSEAMYLRQSEIDRILFEDYRDEIAKKGFTVTGTSATNEYIEIGITPFSEENAAYLREILGDGEIRIVEGVQAATYSKAFTGNSDMANATDVAADNKLTEEAHVEDANIVSALDDAQEVAKTISVPADAAPTAYTIAGIAAVVLAAAGCLLVMKRRVKAAR